MTKVVLGYWGIAGLAQPIRYLLAYSGINWEQKIYTDRSVWFEKDKNALGFKYPNIPYLIDGNKKITQSQAILRYIPKRIGKPELLGQSIQDQLQVDTILGVIGDASSPIFPLVLNSNFATQKQKVYKQKIQPKVSLIQKNISKQWVLNYLTIADFRLSVLGYSLQVVFPEHLNDFKGINRITNNMHNMPAIKKYRQTGITRLFPANSQVNA